MTMRQAIARLILGTLACVILAGFVLSIVVSIAAGLWYIPVLFYVVVPLAIAAIEWASDHS